MDLPILPPTASHVMPTGHIGCASCHALAERVRELTAEVAALRERIAMDARQRASGPACAQSAERTPPDA